jgi:hypothetical protein
LSKASLPLFGGTAASKKGTTKAFDFQSKQHSKPNHKFRINLQASRNP